MEEKKEDDLVSGTFTWKIEQFLNLEKDKYYSEVFVIGGFKWRILIHPKGNKSKDYLSMYLDVADSSTLPDGWTRYAKFSLTVVDQLDSNKSITKESEHMFKACESDWGFTELFLLSKISNLSNNYLVNGSCVVKAEVSVRKGDIKILDKETGELMDFRGLGKIELAFLPLLEEVCLLHPSLLECHQKRSPAFIVYAFTTLGQLLHFLKTTKLKDMNREGFERLQLLWDELESFKFDLAWLHPHVQSVLGMKNKAGRVKRMKEEVDILENEVVSRRVILEKEIKSRRDLLAAAEADLEKAKADLMKEEKGFEFNGDMDNELGYPLS